MFLRFGRKLIVGLLLAIALCAQSFNATRADGDIVFDDEYFNNRFDFMVMLKVKKMADMADYRGCTLTPMGKVAIACKAHSRSNPNIVLPITNYEDIWYHDYSPVGLRRYRDFPSECSGFGVIRVLYSEDCNEFPNAVANATIRVLLDLNLHNGACDTLIVPRSIFGSVFSSFSRYGFYEVTTRPENPIPGIIVLNLKSDPSGDFRRVYFHNPQF